MGRGYTVGSAAKVNRYNYPYLIIQCNDVFASCHIFQRMFLPATAVTSPLIIDQFICVQVLYPAAGGSDDWAYGGAGGVPSQDSYRVFI